MEKQEGFGPPSGQEVVLLWLASTAGAAVINQVVSIAVEWMRERFRREPNSNPKRLLIVLYEGDKGQVSEVVEMETADAKPVRRLPQDEFERYTKLRSESHPNCRPQASDHVGSARSEAASVMLAWSVRGKRPQGMEVLAAIMREGYSAMA